MRQSLSEVEVKSGKGKQVSQEKEKERIIYKTISRLLFGALEKSSIIFSTFTASGQVLVSIF